MRKLWRHSRFLFLSIIAWAVSLGLYILVRRIGMTSTGGWNPDNATVFLLWIFASVLFGTTYWLITLVTDTRSFRSRSYGLLILVKSFAMLVAVLCYMVVRGAMAVAKSDMTLVEAWADGMHLAFHPTMIVFFLYVWLTSIGFSFVRQMSAMAGKRVLVNLLLGKYHRPKVETRIFMFLDLEGSTSIAERIGHVSFCRLIQECFRDLADSALHRRVEIYQYVGDEAILTWIPDRGLQDCNCLRVFYEFDQALESRADFYREQFGVRPKFKAGVNLGPATVAEIGVVKREIAYLSDVLNTAARLESMCRKLGADLLVTEELKNALPEVDDLSWEPVGNLELRGKSEPISVFRVEEN